MKEIHTENRAFKLVHGDIFTFNDAFVEVSFATSVKELQLGNEVLPGVICTKKIKRKHWWQFWKPKYIAAQFMYVEKEN